VTLIILDISYAHDPPRATLRYIRL
jgi:hypothetical protein